MTKLSQQQYQKVNYIVETIWTSREVFILTHDKAAISLLEEKHKETNRRIFVFIQKGNGKKTSDWNED
jgi:hypothetical protein